MNREEQIAPVRPHVDAVDGKAFAARFQVAKTGRDANHSHKTKCNSLELRGRRFSTGAVHITGDNILTIRHDR